ncbi:MAG: alkaline phosphatase family protein [Defluviitaleaceae bacterium]|nr:alkaline phosphatase family protein [Defluviitaleaceae bacterium]
MNIFASSFRKPYLACVAALSLFLLAACGQGEDNPPYRAFDPPAKVGLVDANGTIFVEEHHLGVPLGDLIHIHNEIAIFLANGGVYRLDSFDGKYLSTGDAGINFGSFENIAGVVADPTFDITQAHDDALQLLSEGERVMLVVVDGWGWHMHQYFADVQPFLAAQNLLKAYTVFPPYTPVAMSSIFTGELPNVHGVHDRATRVMNGQDIFDKARELGKSSIRVQGGVGIVQTSTTPILIPNRDNPFDTDQAVLDATLSRVDGADFMFVHFNVIDATAHTYGPYSPQNREAMAFVDDALSQLAEAWGGVMIITADHGQHHLGQDGRMGDHLWISHEDIFVPYIIIR